MFAAIKAFFKRNQRKLTITAVITGGAYLLGKYASWKYREFQERAAAEKTARDNMRERFRRRQTDCVYCVLTHLPTIADKVLNEINVEAMINKLRQAKNKLTSPTESPSSSVVIVSSTSTPSSSIVVVDRPKEDEVSGTETKGSSSGSDNGEQENGEGNSLLTGQTVGENAPMDKKMMRELWNEVKIKSFTRTISSIYILTLFTLLTFVQLNLLGRYDYIYSIVSLTKKEREQTIEIQPSTGSTLSQETIKKYLIFSWWMLNAGWQHIVERIERAAETVLSG